MQFAATNSHWLDYSNAEGGSSRFLGFLAAVRLHVRFGPSIGILIRSKSHTTFRSFQESQQIHVTIPRALVRYISALSCTVLLSNSQVPLIRLNLRSKKFAVIFHDDAMYITGILYTAV